MHWLNTATPIALSVIVLALFVSEPAVAEDPGWYIGANAGQSRANIDDEDIASGLLAQGFDTASITDGDRHFALKLFGGYQFGRYFAVEAGYFDLGKFSFFASTNPAGSLHGDIKIKGANLDAVGFLPITSKLAAFGRAGGIYAESKDSFAATGAVNVLDPDRSARVSSYKLGLGLQYNFIESFGIRAEVERYRIDDAVGNDGDIDVISIGMIYRFGGKAAGPERAMVEPAAAETPAVVPVRTQEYCSILDFEFEVNQDEIQREEKEKLAVLGTFLKKYPETSAVIEGHTDNVGLPEENTKLSKRRADSVVAYLVETFQIASARLSAVGYGDSRPLGDNRTEEGKRTNRRIDAIVACATDIMGLKVAPTRLTMALVMEFDAQKDDVKPEYRDELFRLARFLKANPAVTATVEGHTGNLQATPELAQAISERRAQHVVNYLVEEFGIVRSRLSAQGFGQTRRFAYNTSLEGQQENRRVNVIINYPR